MRILAFFLVLILSSAGCEENAKCIDESKITNGMCPQNYDPVCGCDGETYSNECMAKSKGVTSWKEGECE